MVVMLVSNERVYVSVYLILEEKNEIHLNLNICCLAKNNNEILVEIISKREKLKWNNILKLGY